MQLREGAQRRECAVAFQPLVGSPDQLFVYHPGATMAREGAPVEGCGKSKAGIVVRTIIISVGSWQQILRRLMSPFVLGTSDDSKRRPHSLARSTERPTRAPLRNGKGHACW